MSEDRTMNLDAVEEFLSQAKRIYEMQIEGVPEELRHLIAGRPQYETILKRRYGVFGIGEISVFLHFKNFDRRKGRHFLQCCPLACPCFGKFIRTY